MQSKTIRRRQHSSKIYGNSFVSMVQAISIKMVLQYRKFSSTVSGIQSNWFHDFHPTICHWLLLLTDDWSTRLPYRSPFIFNIHIYLFINFFRLRLLCAPVNGHHKHHSCEKCRRAYHVFVVYSIVRSLSTHLLEWTRMACNRGSKINRTKKSPSYLWCLSEYTDENMCRSGEIRCVTFGFEYAGRQHTM